MRISVIIPALNEAAGIEATLYAVDVQPGPKEILVVDGGSSDETVRLAQTQATVLNTTPGRARQMNHGAAQATGDVLLFLHADTLIPPLLLDSIRTTLMNPSVEAGAFRLQFDLEAPLLRFYSRCTHLKWRSICFGDRGLFVRRSTFEAVGGFSDLPMFEDLDLVRTLHRRGGFRFMTEPVTTAARRFVAYGLLRQQLRNLLLWSGYMMGFSPKRLARYYPYAG